MAGIEEIQCLRMVLYRLFVLLYSVGSLVQMAARTQERSATADASLTGVGIVVEAVAKGSASEKSGLRAGDVLLAWSRGENKGQIQSPFDLTEIEIEQAPLGTVRLEGLRGTERRDWPLTANAWGLIARPNFSSEILSIYRESQELSRKSSATEVANAAKRWKDLADYCSDPQNLWLRAWVLFHAAEVLRDAKQWKEADDAYQSALQAASETMPVIQGQLFQAWATAFQLRSDWANAEKYLQQAIAQFDRSNGSQLAIAFDLNSLARIAFERGDFDKSEQYCQQALNIRESQAPGSLAVAASLNSLGTVAWRRGNIVKAEEYYQRALDIREKLAFDTLDLATTFNNLGNVSNDRGDLATAERYHRQALEIREKLAPGSLDVAQSLGNLGIVAHDQGDLVKAEQYYHQSLDIRQKLAPRSLLVAGSLGSLGIAAHERGNLVKAEHYSREALDIQTKLAPGSLDVANSFNNLGNIAFGREDMETAEEYHQQALVIRNKLAPGSLIVAASLGNLGDVASHRGDWAKAIEYYLQALEIFERLSPGSVNVATTLINLGIVAYRRGDLVKACEYYQRALVIQEKLAPESIHAAETIQGLGDVARKSHDLGKAEQYYRQALAIREKLAPGSGGHAESLAAIASVLRDQQQLDKAAEFYAQAVNAIESQMSRLGGSGDVRSGFRAAYQTYYKEYIDLLMTQNHPDLAFQVSERSRARSFLEMLTTNHLEIRKGADPALLARAHDLEELLRGKINQRLRRLNDPGNEKRAQDLNVEINDLLRQQEEIESSIRAGSPAYAALTQLQPLDAKAVQRQLPADTLLLEYSLGESRSYVFAVTENALNGYELPRREEIENQAKRVYALLTERSRFIKSENAKERSARFVKADAEFQRAATVLSRILLGPVASELKQHRLLIVSDGSLHYIPFAALPAPSGFHGQPSRPPLLTQHEIVNLPSASVLATLQQKASRDGLVRKEVVVFADPVFAAQDPRVKSHVAPQADVVEPGKQDRQENDEALGEPAAWKRNSLARSVADVSSGQSGDVHLPRLPFTRDEANAILATVPQDAGMEALGFDANRKLATSGTLAHYRAVHFATHALVDNIHPELSGLVLSLVDPMGQPLDGFLDLQDIYNLDLSADLVVLSACQTALGKEIQGEGLIGMTRGFMYAGAPRVISTLWSVEDFATAKLMSYFYQAMEHDGMKPAQALRQAQIALWKAKSSSSPYFWAGFTIQGDWR